jgi:hypothetical protein
VINLSDKYDKRRKQVESYLDPSVIEANRTLDEEFYHGNEGMVDVDLYNMGDSTPIINGVKARNNEKKKDEDQT